MDYENVPIIFLVAYFYFINFYQTFWSIFWTIYREMRVPVFSKCRKHVPFLENDNEKEGTGGVTGYIWEHIEYQGRNIAYTNKKNQVDNVIIIKSYRMITHLRYWQLDFFCLYKSEIPTLLFYMLSDTSGDASCTFFSLSFFRKGTPFDTWLGNEKDDWDIFIVHLYSAIFWGSSTLSASWDQLHF